MPYAPSSDGDSATSGSRLPTSAPSSPPPASPASPVMDQPKMSYTKLRAEQILAAEEEKAREQNNKAEDRRKKKWKNRTLDKTERETKAKDLDQLLAQSAAFSSILTNKTKALGRVGTGLDGKTLGEHDLTMAKQPKCLVNGTMRDYQLEGLTWMYEICIQGMSGILADEMGLGKTVQTISLIALLREQENYLGPHLIVAPLSTLSNWLDEFHRWVPSIPIVMYHGTPQQRNDIFKTKIMRHLHGGRPTDKFPVVCTSYEMVLKDRAALSRINWEFIIIDEGHRMKNFDSKLFRELKSFTSATRLLITGTPLQNNLKELWSLLNFLLPKIFRDWEAFESWFDFSDLENEEGTEEFIADKTKQELVKKMHVVLQPLLLRRVKADVAKYLPKKREYVLYAPMTKEQTDLYNVINDKNIDTRAYLENKVVERLNAATNSKASSLSGSTRSSRASSVKKEPDTSDRTTKAKGKPATTKGKENALPPKNAFALLMGKARPKAAASKAAPPAKQAVAEPAPQPTKKETKRKAPPESASPVAKSAKSSRQSTPASARGPSRRGRQSYKEADSDDDLLDDDEFEAKLADEMADEDAEQPDTLIDQEESERAQTLELAKREIANKKLGNPLLQLRLVCNSPHNFYNPWANDAGVPIDESIVTASGKMLLLDRLLPTLFKRGHKVLIFSQFKTQLDILEDYCTELRKWPVCRIDGGVAQEDRRAQIHAFNTDPKLRIFLLSTRAGGQGINLASADTVILFDSDWNPQQDLQAQDRAHRIGQTRPVIVYRFATKGTVEEELLMSADAKRRLEKLVIKKGGFRTMGQKIDMREDLDRETLKALLLKDGQVYKFSGDKEVLSDGDLSVLCDRSDEAYVKAAEGEGNANGYKVIETGANGITAAGKA
ncbi:SNF2 family N-terminal domain-containing protein [Staphylotrichum tortipilum]|uniref:SNF2 family N-terminal domain-containing protein n=1 Tax=Staphylotrichum tortipilum TaxID=2831512 RepID=A0AAN6MBU7_9PEZI|nr:SNF2 family N-terminal domain-containing protein [Staphylotrichum longicolle]